MPEIRPFYQKPLHGSRPYNVLSGSTNPFPPHWHGEIEIYYLLSGTLELSIGAQKQTLLPRTAVIISSAEVHAILSSSPDAIVLIAVMGYELLGSHFSALAERDFRNLLLDFNGAPPTPLENVFLDLYRLSSHQARSAEAAIPYDFRVRSLLCLCAAEIMEVLPSRLLTERRRKQVNDLLSMQKVMDFVDSHMAERISVEDAAAVAGYEKTRFCQIFRQTLGVSFHQYLNERRVNEAKRLLSVTAHPIGQIAEAVGLPEAKTFSRVFRAFEGITPTQWRQHYQKSGGI